MQSTGRPCWWALHGQRSWPKRDDASLPKCAGQETSVGTDKFLRQTNKAMWHRQFVVDSVMVARPNPKSNHEWREAQHTKLRDAAQTQLQRTDANRCWQLQTPTLQWFAKAHGLDTQASSHAAAKCTNAISSTKPQGQEHP